MRPVASLALALVALAAAPAAQSRPSTGSRPASPPPQRAERPVPFAVRETLTYDVAFASLTAGSATLTVRDRKTSGASVAYYITAEGRPTPFFARIYPVYYKVDTLLDAFTLLPRRASLYSDERGRRRTKISRFDQRARTVEYEVASRRTVTKSVRLDGDTQDALSIIYVLRTLPLAKGYTATFHVFDAGEKYRVRVAVTGREAIKSVLGQVDAWRLAPVVTDARGREVGRNLAIWITGDARRIPLRMEASLPIGTFGFVLTRMR